MKRKNGFYMIIIIGSGIIGLYIAEKLLQNKKKVLILDTSEVKSNATYASVGMLAPLIEASKTIRKRVT